MNTNTSDGQGGQRTMKSPPIVSRREWDAAREQMLVKEKAFTRAGDALAAERRRMPWTAVDEAYVFEGPKGKMRLLDLFEGRHQLIIYRAFFEPGVHGWPEHACIGCSLGADQVGNLAHLHARNTTLAYASRAPCRGGVAVGKHATGSGGGPSIRGERARLEAFEVMASPARGHRRRRGDHSQATA